MIRVRQRDTADAVRPRQADCRLHARVGVQRADPAAAVPPFERAEAGRPNRPAGGVDNAAAHHFDQPRKHVQAVRINAVPRRVGDNARTQRRALGVHAGRRQNTQQCVVQFLVADSHVIDAQAGEEISPRRGSPVAIVLS